MCHGQKSSTFCTRVTSAVFLYLKSTLLSVNLVEQCETPSAARRLALQDFLIATSAIRPYTHGAVWPPCSTERTAFEKVVHLCV